MITKGGLKEVSLMRDKIPSPHQYPFNIPVLKNFTSLKFHPKVTYFSGELKELLIRIHKTTGPPSSSSTITKQWWIFYWEKLTDHLGS